MKTHTPSYRLHKPTGQAVVTIDGRDFYLGKHGSAPSRAEYDRLIGEWLTRGRQAPAVPAAVGISLDELLLAFWTHAEGHYLRPDGSPSEVLGNIKVSLRPLRRLYGSSPAAGFGPLALRAVRDEMVRSGLARTSVNARINRIRRAFKWAASVELVPVSVVQSLATVSGLQKGRTKARETAPIGPVSLDVVDATLPHLPRPVAAMVRLQLLTGMRPGEACAMRGRDLIREGSACSYRPDSHKTAWRGKDRRIALGSKAMEIVESFLKVDPDARLFDLREAVAEHHARRGEARKSRPTPSEKSRRKADPGSGHARRYSRASHLNAIDRACDRAFPHPTIRKFRGEPLGEAERVELLAWRKAHRWHPNQLRHTSATAIRPGSGWRLPRRC